MREELHERRRFPWFPRETVSTESPRVPDFAALYASHVDFVFKTLQRLGVRESDLEDVLQKVFIDIHQRLHTFDPEKSLEGWIYGICKNECSNYRRIAHRRHEVGSDEPVEPRSDGSSWQPEEIISRRQAQQTLESLLETLDLDKRVVFVMFEVDELPCDEIAQRLDIPVGTVYSRLNAARKAFQKAVERHQAMEARRSRS